MRTPLSLAGFFDTRFFSFFFFFFVNANDRHIVSQRMIRGALGAQEFTDRCSLEIAACQCRAEFQRRVEKCRRQAATATGWKTRGRGPSPISLDSPCRDYRTVARVNASWNSISSQAHPHHYSNGETLRYLSKVTHGQFLRRSLSFFCIIISVTNSVCIWLSSNSRKRKLHFISSVFFHFSLHRVFVWQCSLFDF